MLIYSYRLGGIPLGVIAVETRTVELTVPADPANLDSESRVSRQHLAQFVIKSSLDNVRNALHPLPVCVCVCVCLSSCSRLDRCGSQTQPSKQLRPFATSTVSVCRSWCLPIGGASLGEWRVQDRCYWKVFRQTAFLCCSSSDCRLF